MKNREKTPKDFALYLRSHEDTQRLIATGRLKMGAASKIIITATEELVLDCGFATAEVFA